MTVPVRRLAAILAVDVVGYSRLMGEDEEGTARAVREHREAARPLVLGRGGRIVKTMGDGLLLEFPSVVDAVECAIAVQKLMDQRNARTADDKRIVYRIGINLGDVLVDGDDILGDGVNVAARLEGIAEPGGISMSGAAYDQVRGKIAAEFVDGGERVLKNIARPVRVFTVNLGAASPGGRSSAPVPPDGPPRLSMVVLPFANIGGGPEQDYFADGVTESLTTDMSRMSGMLVIARNTAFAYKGNPVDVRRIGREMGVRYVLEGSVQRGGGRMRVNVQLVDAESGHHLWADRFDKPVADLFDMQDEIVARLAGTLNAQLVAAEARRAARRADPDAIDLWLQGTAWINSGGAPEQLARARGYFERILAAYPDSVEALVGAAGVDTMIAATLMGSDRSTRFRAAEVTVTAALALSPDHAVAHLLLGTIQIFTFRASDGIGECERALALDRNLAGAYATVGLGKHLTGRAAEVEAHVVEALRLSPKDTFAYQWMTTAGLARLGLGGYEAASDWLHRAIQANRNFPLAHFYLSAALMHLGRVDEARAAAQAGLTLNPTFTLSRFRAGASSDHPTYLAQRERYIDAMRSAGVPEE